MSIKLEEGAILP